MKSDPELESRVLAHVAAANYQPVKPRVIAKQLQLGEEEKVLLKRAIKKLVKSGKLIYGKNHAIKPASAPIVEGAVEFATSEDVPGAEGGGQDRSGKKAKKAPGPQDVVGTFRRTSSGFGFVRPRGTLREAGRSQDVYIPERKALDASSGDTVVVRVNKRRKEGGETRVAGEIIDIVARQTRQFVGVYIERGGTGFVQIDGNVFTQPIAVGDAGAKDAAAGDKVVVEMVRFPSHLTEGEGVIVEVLGPRGSPGVDTLSVIREYGLPEAFAEETLAAARAEAEKFDESTGERLDLTQDTIITIDPVDARDFDDAISLVRIEKGHWRLGVHIADVTHFVRPRSPLDHEARERATSVYLPDRVIPMLPEVISNHLASLQPDRVRYAKTCFIEFTPEGAPVAAEVHSTAIKSKRRFTYEEVDEFLAKPKAWKAKLSPEVFDLLGRMHELAMILRKRRLEAGAIELTLPEVKIDLDRQGRVSGAHLVENTVSHQIIEEFMLAANEAVAELLFQQKLFFLRRVHEPPSPKKLAVLTEFVRELGFPSESLASRFEIKRVVAEAEGRPERHAVNYAVLRSMQKAHYSPVEEGHYALASDNYCHFTSPIRRYPDLTVHRLFDILASGKRPPQQFEELVALGEHCSQREQRAEAAERDLIKVKLLTYLSQRVGEEMDAVLTGVEDFGLFAQGIELPAEGFVHVSALEDDYYDYEASTHTLRGRRGNRYRLGDVVRVEVAHVDIDRRELDFRLVSKVSKGARQSRPTRSTDNKKPGKRPSGDGAHREAGAKKGRRPSGKQGRRR